MHKHTLSQKSIDARRRNALIMQKAGVKARTGVKKQQRECKCLNCGKVFWTYISRIKLGRGRYCSRSCKGKADCSQIHNQEAYRKSGLSRRGENNFRWTGTARSHRDRIWRCEKNIEWKNLILKRDDYTCQLCNKRGGKIQIDHIKPFIQIIRENNIRTLDDALMCDELWDINNGRVLCIKCHRKTETYGGGAIKLLNTINVGTGKYY